MKHFNFQNIAIVLLLIVVVQGFFKPKIGISEKEQTLNIKIHDLKQEKELLLKVNSQLETRINNFKDEIIKNDSIIDNATIVQLDSLFTEYFKR